MLPDRYRTETTPGVQGGFGSVVAVHDTFLGRDVLFKSMHDPANNGQLLNEIHGLSRARSRHVVEIYDVIHDANGDITGIVIEKLTGRDYAEFHLEAVADPVAYLGKIYQIAVALRDLHAAGIVHRDLKLDNLRDSAAGTLKLFDFGISSAGTGYHTQDNRGTMVYAAPELFMPNTHIRSSMDIYALGVCCWALALPFQQWPTVLLETPPQRSGRVASLSTVFRQGLSPEVVSILDRCTDPDAALRPSAQDLITTLGSNLLRNAHRGLFMQGANTIYELSAAKPTVRITIQSFGETRVAYDGIVFKVIGVTGDVFMNNAPVVVGMELYDACVLTFGAPQLGWKRELVTFMSSHPELRF